MVEDKKENEMLGGVPARIRALDRAGNSISPTLKELTEAFSFFTGTISVPAKSMGKINSRRGMYIFQVTYKAGIVIVTFGNSLKVNEVSNDTDGGISINKETYSYINIKRDDYDSISIYNNHTEIAHLSFACIEV